MMVFENSRVRLRIIGRSFEGRISMPPPANGVLSFGPKTDTSRSRFPSGPRILVDIVIKHRQSPTSRFLERLQYPDRP